jgi:hypothetical protein
MLWAVPGQAQMMASAAVIGPALSIMTILNIDHMCVKAPC